MVTGSEGLIGRHLRAHLQLSGFSSRGFDLKRSKSEDIRETGALSRALCDVTGVIHLAAVSRVVWGQRDPETCVATNVVALRGLLEACLRAAPRPWVIFASSREVYGQASRLPVREDDARRPMNTYARTKYEGELLVEEARAAGLVANICRFSNVFGCIHDHPDRVAPAFARTAALGGTLRVDGSQHVFDFTHVSDVVAGVGNLAAASDAGERLPPIHLTSGRGTTLGELAALAASRAHEPVTIEEAPPRNFDVSAFIGDPSRAEKLLNWKVRTRLEDTFAALIGDMRTLKPSADRAAMANSSGAVS